MHVLPVVDASVNFQDQMIVFFEEGSQRVNARPLDAPTWPDGRHSSPLIQA
jgi:hypothetical protein